MGTEVHPLATAILSNQTGYDSFKSLSLTEYMPDFINEWEKLNADFDAILTGFVTDTNQIRIIDSFIARFKNPNTVVIVDPVMADNGKLYDGYTEDMCNEIRKLCFRADIITPNIAELAFIAEEKYSENMEDINMYVKKLQNCGMRKIVVTGYKEEGTISNLVYDRNDFYKAGAKLTGGYFSGTGDILDSVITGGILKGMTLIDSVRLATDFISKVIENTQVKDANDGIDFEKFLGDLI